MRGNVTNPAPPDHVLDTALSVAITAAEQAGAAIRAGLTGVLAVRAKDATGDVVTDLDLRAERIILRQIREAFPEHRVLAEESGLSENVDGTWCWMVDPLDGTNNVAVGLPICTVGIALCHNGVPVVGVVHEPIPGRTWSAVRDRGAYGPNGLVWRPTQQPSKPMTLAWLQGYPVARTDAYARALRLTLESSARRLIQLWSPLLCWVMLSRGDIDGFVGCQAGMVDLPAGALLARESGIRLTDFDGAPLDEHFDPDGAPVNFIATRPELVSELTLLVKSAADVTVTGLPG